MKKISWEKYLHKKQDDLDDDNPLSKALTMVQTPFGMFRLDDSLNPMNQFNFWIANTNFNIAAKTRDVLKSIEGVETLSIISKYKFMVGIGKMFDEKEVKSNIETELCERIPIKQIRDDGIVDKIHFCKDHMNKLFKHWSIYVFPNGNIEYFGDNKKETVNVWVNFIKEAAELSRGVIILSDK